MDAMEILCDTYYYGNWGVKDYAKSLFWGEKAIQAGSVNAKEFWTFNI
ncbi:MAG: hypothetical protein LUG61_00355 [Lachnospiraceae bacterium]|nr:hypothetical protein [Lachnospiraceae bacterium]